jgi:gliding motility-associated-like protein
MTNTFTCVLRDSIVLKEICPPMVYIPTGFIPGSKDENATFHVFGKDFTNYKLMIFNRWGEIIFVSTNQDVNWDGTYRGEPMPIGSYPYLITFNGVAKGHTEAQKIEGRITIIR